MLTIYLVIIFIFLKTLNMPAAIRFIVLPSYLLGYPYTVSSNAITFTNFRILIGVSNDKVPALIVVCF